MSRGKEEELETRRKKKKGEKTVNTDKEENRRAENSSRQKDKLNDMNSSEYTTSKLQPPSALKKCENCCFWGNK